MFNEAYEAGVQEALEKIAAANPSFGKKVWDRVKGGGRKMRGYYSPKSIEKGLNEKNPMPKKKLFENKASYKAKADEHAAKHKRQARNTAIRRGVGTAVGVGAAAEGTRRLMSED